MDTEVYTEIIGQGPDLVLLHGWGFHSGIYRSLAKQLSLEYRVTLVDLPGFGRSKALSGEYTIERVAKTVLKYTPKKAIWLGWSLGGLLALWVARYFPYRIKRIITVCCNPKFVKVENGRNEDAGIWPGIEGLHLKIFARELRQQYRKTIVKFLTLQCYTVPDTKEILKKIKQTVFLYGVPHDSILLGGLTLLAKTDLRPILGEIQCPVLYIFGQEDPLVPNSVPLRLKQFLPGAQNTILMKAGHIPFLSHEADFLTILRKFLI